MKKYNLHPFTQNLDAFHKEPKVDFDQTGTLISIAKSVRFIARISQKSIYEATKYACEFVRGQAQPDAGQQAE